jgi:hypothetical protein
MDPRLQAGVELALEKTASEESGAGMLANTIHQKLAEQDQGVEQVHKSENKTPSSSSGKRMETSNADYGKSSDYKLDDDPTKGQGANTTGDTVIATSGKNITTEISGMPDLSMKKASSNQRILSTMLKGQL